VCGISGALGTLDAEVRAALARGHEAQAHRGPDAEGDWFWTDADGCGVAFAHRRLAIIDLSEVGRQPMVDPDAGHVGSASVPTPTPR